MHIFYRNVDSEWFSMCHWNVGYIKTNTFNPRNLIFTVAWKCFHASEQSHSLILGDMSEQRNFVPPGRYLIGMGIKRMLALLFLLYCTNKASFQNCLWGTLKPSPILFGVGRFFGRRTSIYETTGLNWSNLDAVSLLMEDEGPKWQESWPEVVNVVGYTIISR